MSCEFQKLGQRCDFVGAALPRWRWLVVSPAVAAVPLATKALFSALCKSLAEVVNAALFNPLATP